MNRGGRNKALPFIFALCPPLPRGGVAMGMPCLRDEPLSAGPPGLPARSSGRSHGLAEVRVRTRTLLFQERREADAGFTG